MDEKQKKGRKKIPSHLLKIKVWAHIEQYKIDALGGKKVITELIEDFLNSKLNNNEIKSNNEKQSTSDSTEV